MANYRSNTVYYQSAGRGRFTAAPGLYPCGNGRVERTGKVSGALPGASLPESAWMGKAFANRMVSGCSPPSERTLMCRPCRLPFLVARLAVREPFRHVDRLPTGKSFRQIPCLSVARARKQCRFPCVRPEKRPCSWRPADR